MVLAIVTKVWFIYAFVKRRKRNMKKYNDFSAEVQTILKDIDNVKKALRNKKYCYDECDEEIIKKMFLVNLKSHLFSLQIDLDTWINNGEKMTK